MPDFDLTGELSLKLELHMLRPITEKSTQWQWASFVSAVFVFSVVYNIPRPEILDILPRFIGGL